MPHLRRVFIWACAITGITRYPRVQIVVSNGKFAAYSGEKLANKLGVMGGQNAISEAVKIFRDTVVDELASKGISCGREDVLLSRGCGYRLAESIAVRVGERWEEYM